MDAHDVNRSDVLLAIIAAAGDSKLGRVHLQKAVFLVADEYEACLPAGFYRFKHWDFGPFSYEIYQDAEMLSDWGLIHIDTGSRRRDDLYSIAKRVQFEEITLPTDMRDYIQKTVCWLKDMTFEELVRAIYFLFPEYRSNSMFSYSDEEAMTESFVRSYKQMRAGEVQDGWEALEELRSAADSHD